MQVVLGVLGCPNLPQQPIQEEDGAAGVAERVGTEGIGCLFTAIKGQGAFVGALNGKGANYQGYTDVHRPTVKDATVCCACSSSASFLYTMVCKCQICKIEFKKPISQSKLNRAHAVMLPMFLCSMVCSTSKLAARRGGVVNGESKGPL